MDILILGASGFLGRFFLLESLKNSKNIYLIIRNPYQKRNILEFLKLFGIQEKQNLIQFFIGDASQPKFKLKEEEWIELSKVNKIFNLAGSTNFLYTRKKLTPQNVDIIKNCITLAQVGKEKEIHHISTLSILLLNDLDLSEISENSEILETTKIYGGYAQTKLQAEYLLQNSNVTHYIYRLGLLVGDTKYGLPNFKDSFTFFLKTSDLWKDLEFDKNLALDFLPVDLAAKEILNWSERQHKPPLVHIFGDTLYIHELQKAIKNKSITSTSSLFEREYTNFLIQLVKYSYHRIHPLGLFLKTNRNFLSNYYTPVRVNKELLLQKILSNL